MSHNHATPAPPLGRGTNSPAEVSVNADEARRLRQGQGLGTDSGRDGEVAILDEAEQLVGLGVREKNRVRPVIVFPGS